MNDPTDIYTYSKSENGHIYSCIHCGMIHLVYKSLAVALYQFEFDALLDCLDQLEEEHFDFPHPNGLAATLTFNKFQEGFFCIVRTEFDEFHKLVSEASLMINVHRLIY